MRLLYHLVLLSAALSVGGVSPLRADDEEKKSRAELKQEKKEAREAEKKEKEEARKEARTARRNKDGNKDLEAEIEMLGELTAALPTVVDEKSAQKLLKEYEKKMRRLKPVIASNAAEIDRLAAAQNKLSDEMYKLKNLDYFESGGLQALWTLATDQLSRRRLWER